MFRAELGYVIHMDNTTAGHSTRVAAQGFLCTHPLGFTTIKSDGALRCGDCNTECPGPCVCGASYRSMVCQNKKHLHGARIDAR